ncbi:glycoside hydrolase family 127 protein [Paenibacillus turpanensis]|uniref:glycoside hydrolase family 127 protein n=1 Tax=Paenibacillus turpanensis TaxID=2689078 RepID=UPI00140A475E|nr:beta-L-arabinofuranosidase domain-containing protein [Paenibacillus turpanensis]
MKNLSIGAAQHAQITDPFWSRYTSLVCETIIPYQWKALNDQIPDAEPSYAVRNFRIAAGLEEGEFGGMVFQDSDPAKWLEAVGYSLQSYPDPQLEQMADGLIDVIVSAQQEDGYLNTYFTIKEPGARWTNLHECHELYCAGHLIEAAVAYYAATGKRKLLDAMCKYADYIDTVFGAEPGKLQGYDGHQEIELALVKLYEVTGESRYLRLSQYFIDQRGQKPYFFVGEWKARGGISHWRGGPVPEPDMEYGQSHLPVREQTVAVGHAVRAVYMYTAMADLARLQNDEELLNACRRLWGNIVTKQMYITGGIGSTHHGEAFSFDYDLPNDTVYAETCASIGLVFFAQRMLRIEPRREYADVMERALYNLVLGSMSLDGMHYFYVNPLEVWPEACRYNPGKHHVKPVRQKWFGCSCCPPNAARLLASLGQYLYTVVDSTLYVHLFIGHETNVDIGGNRVRINQQSALPWHGQTSITLGMDSAQRFTLAMRLPSWVSGEARLTVNGQQVEAAAGEKGYVQLDREWADSDRIEWQLPMKAELIEGHPSVRAVAGKAAIQRGPLVYCFEEQENGRSLSALTIDSRSELTEKFDQHLLGGVCVIQAQGWKNRSDSWNDGQLYRPLKAETVSVTLTAIPYFLWGNRGEGEMSVWLRVR